MWGTCFDLYPLICKIAVERGFSPVQKLFRSKQDMAVYGHHGIIAIIHGPFKPKQGLDIQDEFEVHLRKMMDHIEKLRETLSPKGMRLIFQGSGTLALPDWFREWAEQNGIEINIISEGHHEEIGAIFNTD